MTRKSNKCRSRRDDDDDDDDDDEVSFDSDFEWHCNERRRHHNTKKQSNRHHGPEFSFGKRCKHDRIVMDDGPGPCSYTLTLPKRGTMVSLKGSHQYNVNTDETPGPGLYNVKYAHRSNAVSMKGRFSHYHALSDESSPGPAHYSIRGSIGDRCGRSAIIQGRPLHSTHQYDSHDMPAPAQYNVKPLSHGPAATISSRPKENIHGHDVPSPSAYSVNIAKSSRATIIGGRRTKSCITSDSPGPGSYSPLYAGLTVGNAGPSVTMTGRHHDLSGFKDNLLGPGSYKNTVAQGPFFSLKGRARSMTAQNNPGPASYTVTTVQSGPSFTFGGRQRDNSNYRIGPGPGDYNVSRKLHS